MQTLSLTGPGTGSTELPGPIPGPIPPGPGQTPLSGSAPIIAQNTVTEEAAIGAAGHTKIATLSGFPGTTPVGGVPSQSVSVGGMVDSKFAVDLMDAVLPSLMVFLLYKVGMKLRKADLQLTEKEKGTIAPVLQKCLDQLMINFNNPWAALTTSILVIYGSKILEKGGAQWLDNKNAGREQEALKERENTNKAVPENKTPDKTTTTPPPIVNWEPPEDMVKAKMKRHSMSKARAISTLKNLYKAGRLIT